MPDETPSKAIASEALNHLDALAANPSFAWFMDEIVRKARDEEREKALSTSATATRKIRERGVWRCALAQTILDAPKKRREEWEKTLKRA